MVYYFDTSSGKPELIMDKDELISFDKVNEKGELERVEKKVSELNDEETEQLYQIYLEWQERLKDKLDGTSK